MKTIIIGLGNPILCDDAVGILVTRELANKINQTEEVKIIEASLIGLGLLDEIDGYERLVIIDAIKSGQVPPGKLMQLTLEDLPQNIKTKQGFLCSSHGIDLKTSIELGRRMGYSIPRQIDIFAIEVIDNTTFKDTCTPVIEKLIPELTWQISKKIFNGDGA